MNIAEIVYGKEAPHQTPLLTTLPCCPAFTIHNGKECWYFTDREGTLRRKHQRNTSFQKFLISFQSDTDYLLSCIEQSGQQNQSSCTVISHQEMKRYRNANEMLFELGVDNKKQMRVELIPFDRGCEIFAVHYTPNHALVPQSVSLNSHMKRLILSSLAALAHQFPLVHAMKMWVQKNRISNQLTLLLLSDMSIQSNINFQGVHFKSHNSGSHKSGSHNTKPEEDVPKKKEGSSLLRKFREYQGCKNVKSVETGLLFSKPPHLQAPKTKEQIHQCAACRSLIEGHGKMIAQHQVPKIQCLRSIRITMKERDTMYDMIRICEQCYILFCKHILQKEEKPKSKSLFGQSQGKKRVKRVSEYVGQMGKYRPVFTEGRSSQLENNKRERTTISKHSDYSTKIAVGDNSRESILSRDNEVSSQIKLRTAISEYGRSFHNRH